jgi:multicomponent Na+:H+ antiporter subunit B
MNSLILRTATKYLMPLMLMFSIFLLIRGHNEPGGGFTAGLVVAAAFALYALATDVPTALRALQVDPHTLIGAGLLLAVGSGFLGLIRGQTYLTGYWVEFPFPGIGVIELGSPFFFDVGVYLVVFGVALMIVFALAEE